MKQQYQKSTQKQNVLARALDVPVASLSLSTDTFYSAFLAVAVVLTVLLYGGVGNVGDIQFATASVNMHQARLENKVNTLVQGYPIAEMTEVIAKQNKTTASFLVGIAKKESNWGKRVPRADDGSDCYNYWGYRGAGSRGIAMGHGCFGSPEEAVNVVGGRIDTLVNEYHFKTAAEMVVWKCGWSCDGHSNQSVKKWIADVGYYKQKISN
jgi:hypothetical protein